MILLEFRIRRALSGSYHLIVYKQESSSLNLPFNGTNVVLNRASFPDFDGTTFYLRGTYSSRNFQEIKVIKSNRNLIINVLYEYCNANNLLLSIAKKADHVSIYVTDNVFALPNNIVLLSNIENMTSIVICDILQDRLNGLIRTDFFTAEVNAVNLSSTMIKKKSKLVVPEIFYSCSFCEKKDCEAGQMVTSTCCQQCYDSLPQCHICHKKSATNIEYNDDFIGKVSICSNCFKLKDCINCNKNGLVKLFSTTIEINSDGKDVVNNHSSCPKCTSNLINCKNCGYFYNSSIYDVCPCRIPKRFKEFIHPYNANVLDFLPMDQATKELFGIEIEVGVPINLRHKYREIHSHTNDIILNDGIMVYDSSIDYINKAEGIENKFRGFEIVSRPLTYKNMINFIRSISRDRHPNLRSWEVGTTGIHIHVNKQMLSNIDIGKILVFTSDKKNRKFIKMIAKREDSKYAKFVPRTMADYNDDSPECHYYAINTNKPHTIEFRVFRGTLNEKTLISYFQYVKSLIDYVKLNSVNNLRYEDYVNWLVSQTTHFPELIERIRTENFDTISEENQV